MRIGGSKIFLGGGDFGNPSDRALRGSELTGERNLSVCELIIMHNSWWRGTVVERRSLAGELSLSCARPAADG